MQIVVLQGRGNRQNQDDGFAVAVPFVPWLAVFKLSAYSQTNLRDAGAGKPAAYSFPNP